MLTIQGKRNAANELFKANKFWEAGVMDFSFLLRLCCLIGFFFVVVPAIRDAMEASKAVPHYALVILSRLMLLMVEF